MKEIKLTRGKVALVDDADFEWLSKFRWRYSSAGYAVHTTLAKDSPDRKRKVYYMHKLILKPAEGLLTDHIDGNKLNNQRSNLRECTPSQNRMNQGKNRNNKIGFKGVRIHKRTGRFMAGIGFQNKYIYLGMRATAEEAHQLYVEACKRLHGEFGKV